MPLRLSSALRNHMMGATVNMATNGEFSTVTTGWTASNATLTSEASGQAGNCLRVAESGGSAAGQAYQDITTLIGHFYKITVYFKKGTADAGRVLIGTTGDNDAILASPALTDAAWAQKVYAFVATATTTRVTLESTDATAGEYSEFDTFVFDCIDSGIKEVFKDCFIDIYSGAQPSLADDAPTGTKLVTIYSDGTSTGLEFEEAASGVMAKATAETWSGTGLADGTAGWFRMRQSGDPGTLNYVSLRIDGACGTSGAQLNMTSLSIATNAVQTISTFTLTMPQE